MRFHLQLKALSAGVIAAMTLATADAAPVEFVFSTGAIAGSTTNYSFNANEMTFTQLVLHHP